MRAGDDGVGREERRGKYERGCGGRGGEGGAGEGGGFRGGQDRDRATWTERV